MTIGTSILSLMGRRDPRERLLQVAQPAAATQQDGAQYPAAAEPEGGVYATQASRDAAAAQPQQPVNPPEAEAYTSPSELMGMYKELLDYQSKANNVDRGIALLGSAFAHPENRANIMQAFSPGQDAGLSSMDPIAIQKGIMELRSAEEARTQRAAMLAQLPMIAKKYGIDEATAAMLFQNEQLDDFVAEREKTSYAIKNEAPATAENQGQTIGFDKRTGKELYRIGVPNKPGLEFQKVGEDLYMFEKDTGKQVRKIAPDDKEYLTIEDTDGTTMIVDKKNPGKVLSRIGTPKDMTATDDTKEYDRYAADTTKTGGKPITFQEWQLQKQKASATNVTVNNGGEKKFNEKMGEEQAKRYVAYQQAADSARKSKEQYSLAEKALDSGLETGFGADAMLAARKVGQTFGLDVDENAMAAAETLKAASNQMAMMKRNPESGMGLPGSVSDRDLQFLKDADFNLSTSREGNKMIIKVARKMAERNEQVAMMAAEYVEKNGQLDTGWEKQIKEFADKNPLFDDLEFKTISPEEKRLKAFEKYGVPVDGN